MSTATTAVVGAPEFTPPIWENPCTFSRLHDVGAPAMRGLRRHRARARLRGLCAGLLALAAMALSVSAGAANIIGIQGGTSGHVILASSNDAAQEFTTGAYPQTGVTLTGIRVNITTSAAPTVPTMTLRTGSATGTEVVPLTASGTLVPNGNNTLVYMPSTTTKLAVSTSYWVVLEGGSDGVGWNYANAINESYQVGGASAADTGETRGATSVGAFSPRASGAFKFRVLGTPDLPAPPDPAKVLVHNLDPVATTGPLNLSPTNQVAQVFRTGAAAAHTLESIELAFGDAISATDIGDLSASVWSVNASGHPDAWQFDLGKPSAIAVPFTFAEQSNTFIAGPTARFDAPANTVLDGSMTPYAVVLLFDAGRRLFSTASNTQTTSAGFTIDDNAFARPRDSSMFNPHPSHSLLLRVNGAVVTVPDTDPPVFGTAALAADGRTLTLTYDEALNASSTPAGTAFTVKATPLGGVEATDLAAMAVVSVAGSTVVLTLAKPIAHDDGTVTVTYTKPASGVIEDAAGNDAGPLTDEAVTNNSLAPRVTIAAVHSDATPGIANPVFRVIRSNTDADNALTVDLTVTQAAEYLASTTQTITIPANETTAEKTFESSLFDSNVSGDLTATVAGGDDHLPGVTGNAATVAMKLPGAGTGSIATLEYGQSQGGWSVVEGETLDLMLTLTTAANVARPRAPLSYALYTIPATATRDVDYTHKSVSVPFPATG